MSSADDTVRPVTPSEDKGAAEPSSVDTPRRSFSPIMIIGAAAAAFVVGFVWSLSFRAKRSSTVSPGGAK